MNLAQIIELIAIWVIARLNALKVVYNGLKQQVTTLGENLSAGLADRFTKTESDDRYLGKTATAANADMLGGKTLSTIESERNSAINIAKSEALAAAKSNVKRIFHAPIANGTAVDVSEILSIAGLSVGSSYEIAFEGGVLDEMTVTGLKSAAGVAYSQVVSAGDRYILDVVDSTENVGEAMIGSGIFVNSLLNAKFNAIQAEQNIQNLRLESIDNQLADLDGTWATDASVDSKLTNAFASLYAQLTGSGYTDPN